MPIKFRIHVVLRTIIAAWNTLNLGKRSRYIFDRKEIKRCKHKSLPSKSVVLDFFSQQCKKLNYHGVAPPPWSMQKIGMKIRKIGVKLKLWIY